MNVKETNLLDATNSGAKGPASDAIAKTIAKPTATVDTRSSATADDLVIITGGTVVEEVLGIGQPTPDAWLPLGTPAISNWSAAQTAR